MNAVRTQSLLGNFNYFIEFILVIFNASFCEDSYYSIVNGDVACSSNSTCLLCRLTDAKRGKRGEFATVSH